MVVSRSSWATVASIALVQLLTIGYAQDVPSNDNYLRKAFARTTVINNHLYIDGGEVNQRVNGRNGSVMGVNSTLSIDLSRSWTPEDVEMKQIEKRTAPKMMRQALFTDASSDAFYIWGGFPAAPNGQRLPEAELWKFTADGSGGGGAWSTSHPPGHTEFTRLTRSQGGSFVSTPDSGFYFGGFSQANTDPNPNGPVPGYLQFNYTSQSQAWTNHTKVPYSQYGNIVGGAAQYIPNFGPNGLIMILGGSDWSIPEGQGGRTRGYNDLDELYFMDPVTHEWYNQSTTGNAPSSRMWHCTVGAQADNNTYEIFLFGGSNIDSAGKTTAAFDDVHVLSLPGFVWEKVDYESTSPRDAMGCAVAGNRQMITVGGVNRLLPKMFEDKDPFPQGIGVFDMTDLKWKDEYDAGAAPYAMPQVLRDWYNSGNLANVEYTSDDVAELFRQARRSPSNEDSSSISPGAIAGAVVGGVVAAVLIAALVFFLIRRRRRRPSAPGGGVNGAAATAATAESAPYAAQHAYSPVPPSTTVAASELQGDQHDGYQTYPGTVPKMIQPPELDANPRGHYAVELDGMETRKK